MVIEYYGSKSKRVKSNALRRRELVSVRMYKISCAVAFKIKIPSQFCLDG
jgi:hypothetical protein